MDRRRLGRLRTELMRIYPGDGGLGEFTLFLGDHLGDEFKSGISGGETIAQRFQAVLVAIEAAGRAPELLETLMSHHAASTEIADLYAQERAALGQHWPAAQVTKRRADLSAHFLMCKGFPLIDRRTLAQTLDELLDHNAPTRVGVVTGMELCGKSWIRHLLQSKCDTLNCTLVDLDLEQIAPGEDVRLVCELLMRQMAGRDDIVLREQDTKSGQYVQRFAYEVGALRQRLLKSDVESKTLVIAIDSLNKSVGDTVLDFVEQLVTATRTQNLKDTKMVLLGFPRDSARFGFCAREAISPLTESDIDEYLANVATVVGAPLAVAERQRIARDAIALTALPPGTELAERLRALADMSRQVYGQVERMVMR